jgi:hypothetical protein
MINLRPVSRDSLLGLKDKTDLERRLQLVNNIVSVIYGIVIKTAKYTDNKRARYRIPSTESLNNNTNFYDIFHITNMELILGTLRECFPGTKVDQVFIMPNSKYESVNPENNTTPLSEDISQGIMYIVVDWS